MIAYFVSSGYDGCYYVRCVLPMRENGWTGEWSELHLPRKSKNIQLQEMLRADIVVFQRPLTKDKYEVARLLKLKGKKIVLDNDDTYRYDAGVPLIMKQIKKAIKNADENLKEFARLADLITLSTEQLRNEYEPYNKNIKILPNCIDPDDWDEPLKNNTDKVRIGITGSIAYSKDYLVIKDVLKDLSKRKDVQLVLLSLPDKSDATKWQQKIYKKEIKFWESLNVEKHPTVPINQYIDKLNSLRLDIQLIPRQNNYFNRCKSNIKYLESSMLEIPVIAQSFGDGTLYEKDINGENGRLAITQDDWQREIEFLIQNKEARIEIGKKAKQYTLENYNISKHAIKWQKAYKKISR